MNDIGNIKPIGIMRRLEDLGDSLGRMEPVGDCWSGSDNLGRD